MTAAPETMPSGRYTITIGDSVQVMRELDEASVDAIVCDPPYGLEFMGKEWDKFKSGRSGRYGVGGSLHDPADRRGKGGAGPQFVVRPAKRCRQCGRQAWSGNPCTCEPPQWELDHSPLYAFQAWCEAWAREALRVLKPGGHLLAFGGTRTYHRLACAVEDAGFEIRDSFLYWGYGSGFPKSLAPYRDMLSKRCPSHANVKHAVRLSAPIPASLGKEREGSVLALVETHPEGELGLLIRTGKAAAFDAVMVIGPSALTTAGMNLSIGSSWNPSSVDHWNQAKTSIIATATEATTDPRILRCLQSLPTPPIITPDEFRPDGCECDALPVAESSSDGGWRWSVTPLLIAQDPVTAPVAPLKPLGTAAKPSYEPIVVARKPLAGTVAANVLEHGTGALNIDGCRIGFRDEADERESKDKNRHADFGSGARENRVYGADERARAESGNYEAAGRWPANVVLDEEAAQTLDQQSGERLSGSATNARRAGSSIFGADGRHAGVYGDSGGASRFFYVAKASRAERNAGLDGFEERVADERHAYGGLPDLRMEREQVRNGARNHHPTVKPVALMRWLVRLVTPPDGLVLDPFAGSGTTGIAAALEGFRFHGVEQDADYARLAEARIAWWAEHGEDALRIVAERERAEAEREVMREAGQLDLLNDLPPPERKVGPAATGPEAVTAQSPTEEKEPSDLCPP